ncbi:hypothetical protein Anas_00739 [Armadillidium nasatum]|uniref:Uncharacterized protein n=1 Tax=Armadillidium nasatum TaxID=96803 RepID=A0A5N5TM02_9CRUS|nr:hypothetical protein Anas_00739 [Armadillidium nasatum]
MLSKQNINSLKKIIILMVIFCKYIIFHTVLPIPIQGQEFIKAFKIMLYLECSHSFLFLVEVKAELGQQQACERFEIMSEKAKEG